MPKTVSTHEAGCELVQKNEILVQRNKTLTRENEILVRKKKRSEQIIQNYNSLVLISIFLYTIVWAPILYCANIGIKIFSKSFKSEVAVLSALYILLGAVIAPSVSLVIYSYYYSYARHQKNNVDSCEEAIKLSGIKPLLLSQDSSCKQWIEGRWLYHTQAPILQRHLACCGIHMLLITAYLGVYYLAVKGLANIVIENYPKQEWHKFIIVLGVCCVTVMLSMIDVFFYHAVKQMIWFDVPPVTFDVPPVTIVTAEPDNDIAQLELQQTLTNT